MHAVLGIRNAVHHLPLMLSSLSQAQAMNSTKMAMLFLSMIFVGAAAHRLLEATSHKTEVVDQAAEHQRILAELEEVHQLRERMLQEGKSWPNICS